MFEVPFEEYIVICGSLCPLFGPLSGLIFLLIAF